MSSTYLSRSPEPRGRLHRARLVSLPEFARWADDSPERRGDCSRRRRVSLQAPSRRRPPASATDHPAHLRRTYISIALLAKGFDVLWVMRQVGHADSKMTMDVYAQLL
jgi:integrase